MPDLPKRARAELRRIYARAEEALRRRPGLFCELSGCCCRFREAGHQLYVTRLEFEEMKAHGEAVDGDDSDAECPWLKDGLCGNREGRALACRTYFCSDENEAAAVGERFHAEIRRLHERHDLHYDYATLARHFAADRLA